MRDLFLSETRFIKNMIRRHGSPAVDDPLKVVVEYYDASRSSRANSFNADFFLQFVAMEDLEHFRSFSCPVRPNTMGAELFLTVDRSSGKPLRAELIAGEAFPVEYFGGEVSRIEQELLQNGVRLDIQESRYARILVIENEICFLVFPDDPKPHMRGEQVVLTASRESSIVSYSGREGLVCVDGWIRTDIAESEWYLVAEPVDED